MTLDGVRYRGHRDDRTVVLPSRKPEDLDRAVNDLQIIVVDRHKELIQRHLYWPS